MTKTLLAVLTLAMMTGAASAQSKTFYDVVGRSSTDSQGTATNYDARGRVASATRRSSPSANHASQSGTLAMDRLSAVT